jgi:hypothetical protein
LTRARARAGRAAAALGLWLGSLTLAAAGAVRVNISLPLPPRLDAAGAKTILVVHFLANDHPDLDLSGETVKALRRLLEKHTAFRILDVEPPNIPEQNLADLLKNQEYWREIGRRYGADLILSGEVGFGSVDRSGFIEEEFVSPVTGQRIRRTRYAERESFDLDLDLAFFWGASGEVAYQDYYDEDVLYEAKGVDHLQVLYDLVGRLEPDIVGILASRRRSELRYLFD